MGIALFESIFCLLAVLETAGLVPAYVVSLLVRALLRSPVTTFLLGMVLPHAVMETHWFGRSKRGDALFLLASLTAIFRVVGVSSYETDLSTNPSVLAAIAFLLIAPTV